MNPNNFTSEEQFDAYLAGMKHSSEFIKGYALGMIVVTQGFISFNNLEGYVIAIFIIIVGLILLYNVN